MRTSLATLAFIIWPTLALAQPMITEQNLPRHGDHTLIAICGGVPDPGDSGADQVWDMSGLVESEEQFFDFVDPMSTPWGGEFDEADLCGISWVDAYSYYGTQDSLYVEGYTIVTAPGDTTKMVYADPEKIVELPYSMGTVFTDTFWGTVSTLGFELDFAGSVDFVADGYGTLILPNATYQNVVRYSLHREQVTGIGGNTQTKDQWAWVSADYRFWLLFMETTFDGFNTDHLIWYDKDPGDNTSTQDTSWSHIKSIY